ncbi:MAG: hypothetical protein ACLQMS_00020 [Desulfomonilaceae bacterium]
MKSLDLSDLNEAYHLSQSASVATLPSGIFNARLVDAEIAYSKDNNRQIRWFLKAEMACNRFGTATKITQLSEMSMPYLKADLETLGISVYDLDDLYQILPDLIGSIVKIEVHDDPIEDNYRVSFLRKVS